MTNGKTIALNRWTFVSKVMSQLFNMLSRLVIASSKEQASFNFMAALSVKAPTPGDLWDYKEIEAMEEKGGKQLKINSLHNNFKSLLNLRN